MFNIKYTLDPDGDIILVLLDANSPFAVPDPGDMMPSAVKVPAGSAGWRSGAGPGTGTDDTAFLAAVTAAAATAAANAAARGSQFQEEDPEQNGQELYEPEVCFRLSSKHLKTASKYFRTQLRSPWKEHIDVAEDGSCIVRAEEWNEQALLIVMNIIHGRSKQVPRNLNLQLMAQVAVIVDYYACHEATWFFHKTWVGNYIRVWYTAGYGYGRDLMLWLFVTITFYSSSWFQEAAKSVIRTSTGTICAMNLPIASAIIGE
ncbi:Uncharacterized protein TPAR_07766 [Tolypocladium paradoxum]|uniref:BTB domain-containing protein n=1 Tax=Tolypocladium paradoxum TaxID=94208 RepID=A0A2S4KPC3_9HYPO|nr:Uncharacterized protein TPAR_07766 [Tolypocladium paradoxum]